MTRLIFASILCLCIFAPGLLAQAPDPAGFQALVAEIHQLRLAVERTGAATPKIQITLMRLQFQEQKVARVSTQLSDVRKEIASLYGHMVEAKSLETLDTSIGQEQDATRRKVLEEQRREMNLMMEQQNRMLQQLRVQEVELAGSLRLEQAKAEELNDRLIALERSLDSAGK